MKKLIIGSFIIGLVYLGLVFRTVKAAPGCCTGNTFNTGVLCQAASSCASGEKPCDTSANKADVDNNGDKSIDANDGYNPSCYVAIAAPESIKITDFGKLFTGLVAFMLLIAFIVAFVFLVLGGISWITSGGDKAGVEAARNKIINAIIGLIVVAATWALFQLVGGAIGFNILGGFMVPRLF